MKTILFHLGALLGRNENSFTWNFSLESQMMTFPYWSSGWELFSQWTHSHWILLPSRYPAITCLRTCTFQGNSVGWSSTAAPRVAKHSQGTAEVKIELWRRWLRSRVMVMGLKQCPALYSCTGGIWTHKVFCFPWVKGRRHHTYHPSCRQVTAFCGQQSCPGDHKIHWEGSGSLPFS